MKSWDPVGVAGVPEAADEYDTYLTKAYAMMMDESATSRDIAAYLHRIATRRMGLAWFPEETSRQTAVALMELRETFKRELAELYNHADYRASRDL